jgi:hypothetical protein
MVRLEGLGKLKKIHILGTRTRDLPACSVVAQPTTLPRAPDYLFYRYTCWFLPGLALMYLISVLLACSYVIVFSPCVLCIWDKCCALYVVIVKLKLENYEINIQIRKPKGAKPIGRPRHK